MINISSIDTLTIWCTAFWARLNATVLDASADYPDFAKHATHQAVNVFSCSTLLVLSFLLALPHPRTHDRDTRVTLQALMTVIVPTCSLWPSRYIKLARVSRSRVSIPLESIIEDTMEGIIEFRNPVDNLARLFGPGVTVHGRTLRMSIGWKLWLDGFRWWTVTKHKPASPVRDPPIFSPFSSPLISSSPDSGPVIYLDHLPPGCIPFLTTGCTLVLEFTAFSSSIPWLSTTKIISAIPFVLSPGLPRWPRSPVSVLNQLSTSYGPILVVDSFSNVSVDYESALCRLFDFVSEEQKTRDMGTRTFGLKGWRRGMFLVALEAALVRRGWIERWVVQVTVK